MANLVMPESVHGDVTALSAMDEQRALDTLTLAFAADPPSRWLFAQDNNYYRHFPTFARAFGGAAITHGTALATPYLSGVALWLAPGETPNEDALAALIEDAVAPHRKSGVSAVFAEMGRLHPREAHWYLPLIGVDPASQGQGRGAQLLRPVLTQCDADGVPAYLEATSARSVPLYARHGFVPVGEITVGDCPKIVPMLRLPRAA
jgi:GNAT superfamily N-acetyltransferase